MTNAALLVISNKNYLDDETKEDVRVRAKEAARKIGAELLILEPGQTAHLQICPVPVEKPAAKSEIQAEHVLSRSSDGRPQAFSAEANAAMRLVEQLIRAGDLVLVHDRWIPGKRFAPAPLLPLDEPVHVPEVEAQGHSGSLPPAFWRRGFASRKDVEALLLIDQGLSSGKMEAQQDHSGPLLTGYRDLSKAGVGSIEEVKALEIEVGQLIARHTAANVADVIALHQAEVNLKQGFSWLVRSLAKPADPYKPEASA